MIAYKICFLSVSLFYFPTYILGDWWLKCNILALIIDSIISFEAKHFRISNKIWKCKSQLLKMYVSMYVTIFNMNQIT